MRKFWQPVYGRERLKAGQAARFESMSEEFTLYRGASGATYVRGLSLRPSRHAAFIGWVEGDCIRLFLSRLEI